MPNGYTLYRGPSAFDGKPIIVVAVGLGDGSSNAKTGEMVQTYILREDIAPNEAVKTGDDASVCGDCKHRGKTCYVLTFQGPLVVWKQYHKGAYPDATPEFVASEARRLGRKIRFGSYGECTATPRRIWAGLAGDGNTGYTHQWQQAEYDWLRQFAMASCDTEGERTVAKAMGWRTFRVRDIDEPVLSGEAQCPASKEAGQKLTCSTCMACNGSQTGRKGDITIVVHGARKNRFAEVAR